MARWRRKTNLDKIKLTENVGLFGLMPLNVYGNKYPYVCEICGKIVQGHLTCNHSEDREKRSERGIKAAETRDDRYGFSGPIKRPYAERLKEGFQLLQMRHN